jgi:lipopolysaccharide exporter
VETTSAIKASNLRLRYILNRLRKSSFVKNVLVVMSGTATAQAIGFALTPIISRLFSPSDFGIFGSFNSVSTIVAAGATLQYTQAVMLPKGQEDAINLFIVSCLSTSGVGFLCLIVCLVAPVYVNGLMKTEGIWALTLLIMATIVSGLNSSCQAWCVRAKAFKHTSASQVIRSLSSNGSQIGFGFLKGGAAGLIISSVLADMLASINLVRVLIPDLLAFRRYIRWERMKQLAKDYRDFPMYSAPTDVINSLSLGLPVLLLAHFYGIAVAGAYAFGMRILSTPMGFVLTALRQVLFQKASETHNDGGRLMPLYVKITSGLFALAFFPSLVLFIWAPQLFTLIFGSQWQTAGEFARSLVLWMMFMFCNLPAVLFARIIRIQRKMFFFDVLLLSARATVLFAGGTYLSAVYTIMLISLVGAIMNIIFIIIIGSALMKKEDDTFWKGFMSSIIER